MRGFGLVLAVLVALSASEAAQAETPRSTTGPAGHLHQWRGVSSSPHWRPNVPLGRWGSYPRPGVPTFWVWGPSGGSFDYPFADWRGPTGGWGNP
jgi:hypothetical protein